MVAPALPPAAAAGGKATELPESAGWGGGGVSFLLDLDIADALTLR